MYRSTVTSKFQTTISTRVCEELGLAVSDESRWETRGGEVVVTVARPRFPRHHGTIPDGPDPVEAVGTMRRRRGPR